MCNAERINQIKRTNYNKIYSEKTLGSTNGNGIDNQIEVFTTADNNRSWTVSHGSPTDSFRNNNSLIWGNFWNQGTVNTQDCFDLDNESLFNSRWDRSWNDLF